MDHSYFKDRISAFKDGGLPPYEQAALEEHLKECEHCRLTLAKLERLDQLVEDDSQLDGKEYWERLAKKIERGIGIGDAKVTDIRPAKRTRGLGWKWVTAAASVAVLTFIGLHQIDIFREEAADFPVPAAPKVTNDVGKTVSEEEVPVSSEGEVVEPLEPSPVSELAAPELEQSSPGKDDKEEAPLSADVSRSPAPPTKREAVTSPGEQDAKVGLQQEPEHPEPEIAIQDKGKLLKDKEVIAREKSPYTTSAENLGELKSFQTDKNYKKRLERATAQSIEVGIESADFQIDKAPITIGSEHLSRTELVDWRRRKDSLSRLLLSSGKTRLLTGASVESESGETPVSDTSQSLEQLESQLLQACYHVASLSSDSAEVKRATEIIQGVAADSTSSLRGTASEYLRQLKK